MMGIGGNAQHPDEGEFHGKLEDAACASWCTSGGRLTPLMIKVCGSDGEIRRIDNIHVITAEKKYYCGIPAWEYECSAAPGGRELRFRLYYYPETCMWKIECRTD